MPEHKHPTELILLEQNICLLFQRIFKSLQMLQKISTTNFSYNHHVPTESFGFSKTYRKKNSENYVPGILVFVLIATMTELG